MNPSRIPVLLSALFAIPWAAAADHPEPPRPPSPEEAFKTMDGNRDGVLNREEFGRGMDAMHKRMGQPPRGEDGRPAKDGDERERKPAKDGDHGDRKPAKDGDERERKPSKDGDHGDRKPAKDGDERERKPSKDGDHGDRKPAKDGDERERKPSKDGDHGDRKPAKDGERHQPRGEDEGKAGGAEGGAKKDGQGKNPDGVFSSSDADKSGTLTFEEFKSALKTMSPPRNDGEGKPPR